MKKIIKAVVPLRYHRFLFELWNDFVRGWAGLHYAQYGEDIIINNLLDNKYEGFFVDVGAFHPRHYSNTYFFYKQRSFRGINIEPNPDGFKRFRRMRRRDINLNCGVGSKPAELTYFMLEDPLCNTFSEDYVKICAARGVKVVKTCDVPVTPLKDLLDAHLPLGQEIDFLSVDVENYDLEVLNSLDWIKYRPKVVVVEDHQFNLNDLEHPSAIYKFMRGCGYELKSVCSYSLIFARKD